MVRTPCRLDPSPCHGSCSAAAGMTTLAATRGTGIDPGVSVRRQVEPPRGGAWSAVRACCISVGMGRGQYPCTGFRQRTP